MGSVVVVLVLTMILLLALGKINPKFLHFLLGKVENFVNKVSMKVRKKPVKPWAEGIVNNFSEASHMVGKNMKWVLAAYGCSLFASLCELSCFALCGIGFEIMAPEPLICGYVVATLFAMISITPQGVGVVEAMVVVAFTAYNQNAAAATATALVYRGIVFWMPFIIGAILMTQIKAFKDSSKKSVEGAEKIQKEIEEKGEVDFRAKVKEAKAEFKKEQEKQELHLDNPNS